MKNRKESLTQGESPNLNEAENIDPQRRGRTRFYPPKRLGQILARAYFVTATMIAPLVAVGVGIEMFTQGGVSQTIRGIISPPPPRPEKPDFIIHETENGRTFLGDSLFQLSLKKSMEAYDYWQNFNQLILQDALNRPQPEDVFSTLEGINVNFIYQGVGILQSAHLVGLTSDQVQIDSKNQYLWLNEEGFNLADRFDRLLASTIIQTKIQLIDYSLQSDLANTNLSKPDKTSQEISVLSQELQEDLDYLTWLKGNSPNIELENESLAFISKNEMVRIARLMQNLNLINVEPPRRIKWCGADCLKDYHARGIANPLTGRTELDTNADVTVIAHEIAHSKFNLLIPKFAVLRGWPGQAPQGDRLNYITDYARTNVQEDFAETFAYYVMHGDYFRGLLDELKVHEPKSYTALKQRYDFIKNEATKGLEFTDGGQVRDIRREQRQQEFTGISWDTTSRSLIIQPNPNSWPGKKYFIKEFLVLTGENKIERVTVSLEINSSRSYDRYSYKITISHPGLVTNLTIWPQVGDDRVYVINDYRETTKQLIALGSDKSLNFVLPKSETPEKYDPLEIRVQSLSQIKVGEERKLTLDLPRNLWKPQQPAFYAEHVQIVDSQQTSNGQKMWLVKTVENFTSGNLEYYALIPENFIGEEFKPEKNP